MDKETFQRIVKSTINGYNLAWSTKDTQSTTVMTIWHTQGRNLQCHSKLYDEKVELVVKGLNLNKFPDPSSKLSTQCKYGVITSQLHRYTVANTRKQDFVPAAVDLYAAYVDKGYRVYKIE